MPRKTEAAPIRSFTKAIIGSNGVDESSDILRAVSEAGFAPHPGLSERDFGSVHPLGFAAITDGITVIGGKYDVPGRCKSSHEKARLRGATMKAVRKDYHRLFDALVRFLRPHGHIHPCEVD